MPIDREASVATERCLYCPKLCKFACPVGHESSRETLTPWGMMTLLSLEVDSAPAPLNLPGKLEALAQKARAALDPRPQRTLDADAAETFYGCTGCKRCQTWCDHDNDVPHALYQGRAVAVSRGLAPAAARTVADRFTRSGHAQDGGVNAAVDAIAAEMPKGEGAGSVLFAGCEAPLSSPGSVKATLKAATKLGAPLALARGTACCGRPLYEAGYRDEFKAHVQGVWAALGEREVVTNSPACARALGEWAQEVGVEPLGPVTHATTYLARRLGPHVQAPPLQTTVAYHDPCHLGRGLNEYDAPRRLLSAAVAGGVREAATNREESDCCGASGLLPKTYPKVAKAMSISRADELRATGATQFVTACPACGDSLRESGLKVVDVMEIVARWLGDGADSTG